MKLTVKYNNVVSKIEAKNDATILDVLAKNGYKILAPCGGNGRCGKCKVKLVSGQVSACKIAKDNTVLACQAKLKTDSKIELQTNQLVSGKENGFISAASLPTEATKTANGHFIDQYNVAVDVGTTTVTACLISGGVRIKSITQNNAQSVYGADVIARILHATNSLENVRKCILNQLEQMVNLLVKNTHDIGRIVISANTTMLHIIAGENPKTLGQSPFTPVFTSAKYFDGKHVNLPCESVILLPSANAFIGADILGGIAVIDLKNKEGALLLDLGTNGEMALNYNGKIYCCSAATGSAFEGAEIACGMGGESGAINSVRLVGGNLSYTTINGDEACGICGAGLIDAIACLRQMQLIDSSGLLEDDYYFTKNVFVTRADVRKVQLAKSAVYSGIVLLLEAAGLSAKQVTTVYITGGMGFYLNADSAFAIKMLPQQLYGKIEVLANLSLVSAVTALEDDNFVDKMQQLKADIVTVELSLTDNFEKLFTDNLQL